MAPELLDGLGRPGGTVVVADVREGDIAAGASQGEADRSAEIARSSCDQGYSPDEIHVLSLSITEAIDLASFRSRRRCDVARQGRACRVRPAAGSTSRFQGQTPGLRRKGSAARCSSAAQRRTRDTWVAAGSPQRKDWRTFPPRWRTRTRAP